MASWRDAVAEAEGRKVDDDQTLMNATTGTGSSGGTGSGTISSQAMSNEKFAKALGSDRRGSSMIIDGVDYREPQPPPSQINVIDPESGKLNQRNSQFAKTKKIQLLNPDDIRGLAEQNMFPDDLLFDKDSYGSELDPFQKSKLMRRKEEFDRASSAEDKEFILRKAIEDELSDRKSRKRRDDLLRSEEVAVAAGLGAGFTGGLVAIPLIYSAGVTATLAAAARGLKPLVGYLGEYLIPLATTAGKTAAAVGIYEAVTGDPEMTDEELEQTIQTEVRKAVEAEKDSGSPPLTEQSADSGR